MKKKKLILLIFLLLGIGFASYVGYQKIQDKGAIKTKEIYYCPMHPGFTSDKPGDCAICGMKLAKKENAGTAEILYYRNPMNPQVTSPVPKKDEMGMDYIPVYEDEGKKSEEGILIDPVKQQYIGVKKGLVSRKRLSKEIRTVGRIAYDPELFVAQQEYLETVKVRHQAEQSTLEFVKTNADSLLDSAERKLLLLGMSRQQIQELAANGRADERLYLPGKTQKIWAYLPIYEYEAGLVKEGQAVEAEAVAYPGEFFSGTVVSFNPVIESETRTIRVRSLLNDPHDKLKPEMFINATIKVDLGQRLAVPEEAVLDTGERRIVFVIKEEGRFVERNVTLGVRAGGYYEVVKGLLEGEVVVTSGNFLIDSESRLKSAIGAESHQHGQ